MNASIPFTKMVGTGNDFILVDAVAHPGLRRLTHRWPAVARELCDRHRGVGADGLLVLERSRRADVRMRIFNADGSEAEMCGNGSRCVARYVKEHPIEGRRQKAAGSARNVVIETKAGLVSADVERDSVSMWMPDPKIIDLQKPARVGGQTYPLCVLNTGVPHVVLFVDDLKRKDVEGIGRQIRFHATFQPEGTNVNFVAVLNDQTIAIRTYERGVESETLACGTGAAAAAISAVATHRIPGRVHYEPIADSLLVKPDNVQEGRARTFEIRPPRVAVHVQTREGGALRVEFAYHNPDVNRALLRERIVTKSDRQRVFARDPEIPVQAIWEDLRSLSVKDVLRKHRLLTDLDIRACLLQMTAPHMFGRVVISNLVLVGSAWSVFEGIFNWSMK